MCYFDVFFVIGLNKLLKKTVKMPDKFEIWDAMMMREEANHLLSFVFQFQLTYLYSLSPVIQHVTYCDKMEYFFVSKHYSHWI